MVKVRLLQPLEVGELSLPAETVISLPQAVAEALQFRGFAAPMPDHVRDLELRNWFK